MYMNVHHSVVVCIGKSAAMYSLIISNWLNYDINTMDYDQAIKMMLYKYIYWGRNMFIFSCF